MDKQRATEKWSSLKTSFARTKHKVLERVGNAEGTKNAQYDEECQRILDLHKALKRINKNIMRYLEVLKAYSIEQNEMAKDIVLLYDTSSPLYEATKKNEEAAVMIDREHLKMDEYVRKYAVNPLSEYLLQFKELKARMKELEVRRVDMDRYYKEYSKAMEKSDRSKNSTIEAKYNITKEGYNSLLNEMMQDMPRLYADRIPLFDPLFTALIKFTSAYYAAASQLSSVPLPLVSNISEEDALKHRKVITPLENSAASRNYRNLATFTHPPPAQTFQPAPGAAPASSLSTVSQARSTTSTLAPVSLVKPSTPAAGSTATVSLTKPSTSPSSSSISTAKPISGTTAPSVTVVKSGNTSNPVSLAGRQLPEMPVKAAPKLPQAEALYNFTGEDEGEINFNKGDRLIIHSTEGDWWEGEINGTRGLLPSNYVKLV